MKKRLFSTVLVVFLFSYFTVYAQKPILSEYPEDLYVKNIWGNNRLHNLSVNIGFGSYIIIFEAEELKVYPVRSNSSHVGLRYKLRFCNFYAWGLDLNWNTSNYSIKQNSNNIFPDTLTHHKENFNFHNIGLGYYNRFNFDVKRGNIIGKYLDIGIWGNWRFSAQHTFVDNFETPQHGAYKSRTQLSELNYLTDFHWGVNARLGINSFVIFANYRMSDLLNSKYNFEPTPLVIGIEIDIPLEF